MKSLGLPSKPFAAGVRLSAPVKSSRSGRLSANVVKAAVETETTQKNFGVFKLSYNIDNVSLNLCNCDVLVALR